MQAQSHPAPQAREAEDSHMLRTRTGRSRVGILAIGACLATTAACGDAPAPSPRQTAIAPPAATSASPDNRPPRIRSIAIEPSEARAGDRVALVLDATDPDGDALRTEIEWRLDGEELGGSSGGSDWTLVVPGRSRDQHLEVIVTITDGAGGQIFDTASLFVENTAPVVEAVALEPNPITTETPIESHPRAADPDGDPLRFQVEWWVDDTKLAYEGETLPARFFERGNRIFAKVRAHDGKATGPTLRSETVTVANAAPRFTSSPTDLSGETTLRKTLRAEDADGDRRLRYRLIDGPNGLDLDSVTGEIAWTPSADQAGAHRVEVEVQDGQGGATTQEFELNVGANAPASAP